MSTHPPASAGAAQSDVSQAYKVTVPTIVTTVVALIMTVLRVYVRTSVIKVVGWDDFFNVLAMMVGLVIMGLNIAATYYGLGRHFTTLGPERAAFSIKLLRICEFHMIFSTVFVKISISLFLKRLFLTSRKWAIFFWLFIAFNTITSAIDAAAIFPQCTPVEFNWNKGIPGGKCWSDTAINALGIAQGTIAACTDVILSVLPLVFLWNLKMIWRVKLGICAIMSLGFASGGFALARTLLVPSLTTTHDPTWDLVPLFMWATLEVTFGIIAAAAPALRPLLGHNRTGSRYGYSGGSNSKGSKGGNKSIQSNSTPLQNLSSHISSKTSTWLPSSRQQDRMHRLRDEEDIDVDVETRAVSSDGGSSQVKLWAKEHHSVVATLVDGNGGREHRMQGEAM